jgi:hypothetical protein
MSKIEHDVPYANQRCPRRRRPLTGEGANDSGADPARKATGLVEMRPMNRDTTPKSLATLRPHALAVAAISASAILCVLPRMPLRGQRVRILESAHQ